MDSWLSAPTFSAISNIYFLGGPTKVRTWKYVEFEVQQKCVYFSKTWGSCATIFDCDYRYAIQGYGNTNFN